MASNPMAAMALQSLMGGLAQGNPGQDDGQGAAQVLSQQFSQLRGANPEMLLNKLKQMHQETAALISQTAQIVPGVAGHLASNLRGLQSAMQACEKTLQVQQSVQPIQMSALPQSMGGQ